MNPQQQALLQLANQGKQRSIPALSLPAQDVPTNSTAVVNAVKQQTIQDNGNNEPKGFVDYKELVQKGYTSTQIEGYLSSNPGVQLKNAPSNWSRDIVQPTIIPKAASLTETFGQIQPDVEVFSKGVTTGTGIGVKAGTPLATPPGKWKVISSYDKAPQKGYIGNGAGDGWGNNIVVQNQETGESLRYSHLSEVNVANGDTLEGNRVIGLSGQSGNTTGDHLNLQYIDPNGQPGDVLKSQYAKYLPLKE